jgi:hypothetical protein
MVKKGLFILCLIVSTISYQLTAQIIKAEALLGLNLTQVEGDEVYGFKKPGINIGAGVMIPFAKNWDVSFEITYNQKGAKEGEQYRDTIDGEPVNGAYKLRLNYAEIPVLIHYTDKEFFTIGAGFSFGRLVGIQEWEHGVREATSLNSNTYEKNDFSYIFDLRIRLKGPLKLALRYQNSMVKIRTREFSNFNGDTWTRDQYNKVITLRLIYMFNEKLSRRTFNPDQQ